MFKPLLLLIQSVFFKQSVQTFFYSKIKKDFQQISFWSEILFFVDLILFYEV